MFNIPLIIQFCIEKLVERISHQSIAPEMNPSPSYYEVKQLTEDCVPSVEILKQDGSDDGSERMDMSDDPVEAKLEGYEHKISPSTQFPQANRWNAVFCDRSSSIFPPQRRPSGSGRISLKKSLMAPVKPQRIASPRKVLTPRRKASEKIKEGELRKAPYRLK